MRNPKATDVVSTYIHFISVLTVLRLQGCCCYELHCAGIAPGALYASV